MKILNNKVSRFLGVDAYVQAEVLKQVQSKVVLEVSKLLGKLGGKMNWTPKSIYRTRFDIKSWGQAQDMANNVDNPRNYALQTVFEEVRIDALLTSQIENRKRQTLSADFVLKNAKGDVDEEQTAWMKKQKAYKEIMNSVLESHYIGYNVIELGLNSNKELTVTVIPRTNVTPQNGRFYEDYTADKYILYRELPEFGKWILEFNTGEPGIVNKAVPHVLFKRFAQSCWSELCEIYGIPPRVMKTNTQDPAMLNRAEAMMRDMGAAAWFIIDETENFDFAKGTDTNGDVYNKLIKLCNDEISLMISGAIIGQDTAHGNRSKEEASHDVLSDLVDSDKSDAQLYWNSIIIPALVKIGWMPAGLTFEFTPEENTAQLFEFTKGLLPYKNVDNEWIKNKFGVEVTDKADTTNPNEPNADKKVDDALKKKLAAFFD